MKLVYWERGCRTCHASDGCVCHTYEGEMILLLNILQLLSEYIAVNTDDAVDCVDSRVLECDDDQSVKNAGFDGCHDDVLVMKERELEGVRRCKRNGHPRRDERRNKHRHARYADQRRPLQLPDYRTYDRQ